MSRHQQRIDAGLCIDCDEPPTPNYNGKPGVRCAKHTGVSKVNQGDFEPPAIQDTTRFKDVLLTVINYIVEQDIQGGKGCTQGQVTRETKCDADLVGIAMQWLQTPSPHHPTLLRKGNVPEKYSFRDTRVRVLTPDEYPKNPVMPKARPYDAATYVRPIRGQW